MINTLQYSSPVVAATERRHAIVWIIWLVAALIVSLLVWANNAPLEEVATGTGTVIPSSREQVIQTLEGGIVSAMNVREGDVVQASQVLAILDPTVTESEMEEIGARYRGALARVARLEAEVSGNPLQFPISLAEYPEIELAERSLYTARSASVARARSLVHQSLESLREETQITERLMRSGASSNVDLLRLRRQIYEHEIRLEEIDKEYRLAAEEELVQTNAEVESLAFAVAGRRDALSRTVLRSPVNGIVKDVEVTTIGGVVAPNGRLMDIVPLDDQLMVEVRVTPRDIAFVHPGQTATVKVTAYDYSIFGGLTGEVVTISPDTIQDEVNPEVYYYRVQVRTDEDALVNDRGERFSIWPGMMTIVDIKTGSKTVMQYLLTPVNKAREALRER